MIDQACSLALTYAHSDGRGEFSRTDLVEAMTTVESGVAIGQPYPKHEERATAIHEAGHAVCGHVYMENRLSTRLSIRKRGSSGGHHQAMEIEDRFGHWRSEQVGDLIWGLGAMAAEHVFYDQTTTGVGGDIGMVTWRAAQMVGRHAHGAGADRPLRPDRRQGGARGGRGEGHGALREARPAAHAPLADMDFEADQGRRQAQARRRAARARRSSSRGTRSAPTRTATDYIATRLIAAGELYGDDVTELLDESRLRQARDRRPGRGDMARDLIPPPSPAGRPTPRRDAESGRAAAGAAALAGRAADAASRRRRRSSATASGSCSARWPGIFLAAARGRRRRLQHRARQAAHRRRRARAELVEVAAGGPTIAAARPRSPRRSAGSTATPTASSS